jgi:hypothetical protein
MAAYQLDLSRLSLDWLRTILRTTRMLPSEAVLAEQTDGRLAVLRDRGLDNLADLVSALATPRRVDALARELGLPARFLTVLRRKIGAYQRKPVRLVELPAVPVAVADALAGVGLHDSRQLFDRLRGAGHSPSANLLALSEEAGVDAEVLARILGVCDLLRGPYVGPAFAELLWQAGFRELGDLRALKPDELHHRLVSANEVARCYEQSVPRGEDLRSWLVMVDEVVRGTA